MTGSTAASTTNDPVTFTCTVGTTCYVVIEGYGYTARTSYSGHCYSGEGHYTLGFDVSAGTGCPEDCGDGYEDDATIHPGATEDCNHVDDDCDGTIDEADADDADGDGYNELEGDCNDGDAAVGPGASEIDGNGIDDDCDGSGRCSGGARRSPRRRRRG